MWRFSLLLLFIFWSWLRLGYIQIYFLALLRNDTSVTNHLIRQFPAIFSSNCVRESSYKNFFHRSVPFFS